MKPYPSCALTHSAIDALLELRTRHGLDAASVADIEVGVTDVVPDVLQHARPGNALERKFSMQFCAAAALATGRVDMACFEDGPVRDTATRELMGRVRMVVDPDLPQGLEQHAWSRVTVRLRDGRTLASPPGARPAIPINRSPMRSSAPSSSAAPLPCSARIRRRRWPTRSLTSKKSRTSARSRRGSSGHGSNAMSVLDGIKILELARVPPAEMPGMIMADMGADVLKIETPEPDRVNDELNIRRTIHAFVNRNKRSMTLNMKSPEGQAVFRKLAAGADVIVEGFRPGVMDRLGAGYQAIRELNPRIIYCSLSGFGQDGPYRNYPAHDMNYLSLAGVLNLIGEAGSKKPVIPLNLVADYAGASLHGALGIALALFARERTGRGQQRGHLVPRHHAVAAGGHAEHALLLLRRRGAEPGRGLPGRIVSVLRDLRDARRQAADDRLHRAVAVGELLQGHRAARLRAVCAQARPVRARGQSRGGGGARRHRGGHPHARSRRLVRVPGQARRVRGQGVRDRGDGARSRRSLIAA